MYSSFFLRFIIHHILPNILLKPHVWSSHSYCDISLWSWWVNIHIRVCSPTPTNLTAMNVDVYPARTPWTASMRRARCSSCERYSRYCFNNVLYKSNAMRTPLFLNDFQWMMINDLVCRSALLLNRAIFASKFTSIDNLSNSLDNKRKLLLTIFFSRTVSVSILCVDVALFLVKSPNKCIYFELCMLRLHVDCTFCTLCRSLIANTHVWSLKCWPQKKIQTHKIWSRNDSVDLIDVLCSTDRLVMMSSSK